MTPGSCPSDTSAHPRSRGENRPGGKPQLSTQGSSPLTRGKRRLRGRRICRVGLIPAHAGKTLLRAARILRRRAHPRSRGENDSGCRKTDHGEGSSPLTRGKRPHERNAEMHIRLIPAHAGKTSCGRSTARAGTAHPRSRGENHSRKERCNMGEGSSPLTRGKQGLGH